MQTTTLIPGAVAPLRNFPTLSRQGWGCVLATGVLSTACCVSALRAVQVDFNSTSITPYDSGQDAGTATIEDLGDRLVLNGNAWKKIDIPYPVNSGTVVEFDFRSTTPGEVYAIGFETDNLMTESYFFQVGGSQPWARQDYHNYSGTGWKHYTIPVGLFYTGTMKHVVFVNDHDVPSPTAKGEFRNVQVYQTGTAGTLNFNSYPVTGYDPAQDAGTASIQDTGNRLVLTGNAWKKINLPYLVTRNTVLEFEFQGVTQGEVHSVGFDTDNLFSETRFFQVWGSQTSGIQDRRTYGGSGWTRYTIPIGEYYGGQMAHLVFANDHDVTTPTAQGQFRNVKVHEVCLAADDFVDSIGLGIKAWQGTTAAEGVPLVARVQELGVRHVRDWLAVDKPVATTIWGNLKNAGIDLCFSLTNWDALTTDAQRLSVLNSYKSYLKDPAHGSLVTATALIEHTNEPNLNDGSLKPGTVYFNNTLTSLFRGDPATAAIPILASPLANNAGLATAHATLGDVTALVDFGNIHPYPGGGQPHINVGAELASEQINTANCPVIATETGYHNLLTTTSGHHPASEEATSVYLPRLYFEYSRRGVYRTYFYQLADDDAAELEGHFGIVRADFVTPKPAFLAMRNLIQLMKDPGTPFIAVPINLTFSGATDIRSALFQTRTGKYRLALWREVSVWNNATRQPITPTTANVTVAFPSVRPTVNIYKPTISTAVQATHSNVTSVTAAIGGQLLILEF